MDPDRVAALRRSYADRGLDEADLAPDPFTQLGRWLDAAVAGGVTESNAMVVASVGADGQPSARTVLLKAYDRRGLVFFTHQTSRKGTELLAIPRAALVFPWYELERQVTVTGSVEVVARADVEAYFASRPRGSRLGAWASRQSTVVSGRGELEAAYAAVRDRFAGLEEVPPPPTWGGFRVVPATVEFWQGRPDRLHDRLRYRRVVAAGDAAEDDGWIVERLAP
jgi:pyridoxamine 5'-phosphate oxidase